MREGFPTCDETVMSEKCWCTRISTTLFCCRSVTRDSYLKCGAVEAPGMYIVSAAKGAARGASKIWQHTRRGRRAFGFFGFFVFSFFGLPWNVSLSVFRATFYRNGISKTMVGHHCINLCVYKL